MTYIPDTSYQVSGALASAVAASGGTFTVSYPSGTSQATFNAGLAGTNAFIVVNGNDKYSGANFGISYGASNITVTNNSTQAWPAGASYILNLDVRDGNNVDVITIPVDLASITGNLTYAQNIRVPYAGVFEYAEWVTTKPASTAGKLTTLNVFIDANSTAACSVPLTTATVALGSPVANTTDPTANNTTTVTSTVKITSTGTTAFAEGQGFLALHFRPTTL